MRKALFIWIALACAMLGARAYDLVLTMNTLYMWHSDSLDEDSTAAPVTGFRRVFYVFSQEAMMNPQFTNEYYDFAHSGQIMDFRNTNDMPMLATGVVGYRTNQMDVVAFTTSTDNALLTSNSMYAAQAIICQAMTNISGGSFPIQAATGILSSNKPIKWIPVGNPPEVTASGGDNRNALSMRERNNACVQAGKDFAGGRYVDLYAPLEYAWTNDAVQTGGNTVGIFAGTGKAGHIEAAGSLNMAICVLQQIHATDTNVSNVIVDWLGQSVSWTNRATATSISRSGNTLTFTYRTTRMPGAWDVQFNDPTNWAMPAFQLIPSQADAFVFSLGVSNLPAGMYETRIDGVLVSTLSDSVLGTGRGWNMYTNIVGPLWAQRFEVLRLLCVAQHIDPTTKVEGGAGDAEGVVSYGSTAFSFWGNSGGNQRGDALIASMDAKVTQLKTNWTYIHLAAQETNHIVTITRLVAGLKPRLRK